MNALLVLWLLGAAGLAVGAVVGWWSRRRNVGLGPAIAVAAVIGAIAGIGMAVVIFHEATTDPSPNAPLALMALPIPIISNAMLALMGVLVARGFLAVLRPR